MHGIPPTALGLLLMLSSLLFACTDNDLSPYPTDPGRWWYYQTRSQILKEVTEQRLLISNLSRDEHLLRQRRQASWDHQLRFTREGVLHQQYANRGDGMGALQGSNALVLPARLEVGERWDFTSALRLIEARTFAPEDRLTIRPLPVTLHARITAVDEVVKVPAGRYVNCIRVEARGETEVPTDHGTAKAVVRADQTEWYAPGVGLVRMRRQESSDSSFLARGEYSQELLETAP